MSATDFSHEKFATMLQTFLIIKKTEINKPTCSLSKARNKINKLKKKRKKKKQEQGKAEAKFKHAIWFKHFGQLPSSNYSNPEKDAFQYILLFTLDINPINSHKKIRKTWERA